MGTYLNGQLSHKNRIYSWKFFTQHDSIEVYNSSFEAVRKFKINPRLLTDKPALIEKIKQELDIEVVKHSIDWTAFDDVRGE